MSADGFRPAPYLPGRHLQTIIPALLPARRGRVSWRSRAVRVSAAAAVLAEIAEPEAEQQRGTLLLVHGMGGSADSRYMFWTSRPAMQRGWVPVRLNLRNCGGTEGLSRTLYNAGQSDDLDAVLQDLENTGLPRPFAVIGFSLGGNSALRYAGTHGDSCRADAIVAINPPIDLDACSRSLEKPGNALYQAYFMRRLCHQLVRIRRNRSVPGPVLKPRKIRTVRRFDTLYTAPDAGHVSAKAYYAYASSGPHLESILVPTLILSARNDPFVEVETYEPHRRLARLRFQSCAQGGHMGFWSSGSPHFWAARAALDFLDEALPEG